MRFFINSSESRNTEFVTEDNVLWYTVETPWRFGSRTTTITRLQPRTHEAGQIIWHSISPTIVKIGSAELERKEFLFRKAILSSNKIMIGSDGLEYEWKHTGSEPELWSLNTGRCVAYYVSRNIFKGRKRQFIVEPEAEPSMNVIIVAFTIIDKLKKDSQRASSGAAASASSSAAMAASYR